MTHSQWGDETRAECHIGTHWQREILVSMTLLFTNQTVLFTNMEMVAFSWLPRCHLQVPGHPGSPEGSGGSVRRSSDRRSASAAQLQVSVRLRGSGLL